jgi:hypothetical protein
MAPSCGAHLSTGALPSQWCNFRGEGHPCPFINLAVKCFSLDLLIKNLLEAFLFERVSGQLKPSKLTYNFLFGLNIIYREKKVYSPYP